MLRQRDKLTQAVLNGRLSGLDRTEPSQSLWRFCDTTRSFRKCQTKPFIINFHIGIFRADSIKVRLRIQIALTGLTQYVQDFTSAFSHLNMVFKEFL